MEEHQDNFRYERKFILPINQYFKFISDLHSKSFCEVFHKRKINNIYFDTYSFSDIIDNIEGYSIRNKHRIRWYGNAFDMSNKTYEIKIKREFLNIKKSISVGSFKLDSFKNINTIKNKILSNLHTNKNYFFYKSLVSKTPTLINSYNRRYFLSYDKSIRITVDTDLKYFSPITKITNTDINMIIESKFNKKSNFYNFLNNLSLSKNSKYVKGFISTTLNKPSY